MSWRGYWAGKRSVIAALGLCAVLALHTGAAAQAPVPDGSSESRPMLEWVAVRSGDTSVDVEIGVTRGAQVPYRLVRPGNGSYVEVWLDGVEVSEKAEADIGVHRGDVARVLVMRHPGPPPSAVVRVVLSARAEVQVRRRPDGMGLVMTVGGGLAPRERVAPPGPVSISARSTSLSDVLLLLARSCGLQLVTAGELSGQLTLSVSGLSCEAALEVVSTVSGVRLRRLGDVLVAAPQGKLQDETYVEVYPVSSARPDEVAKELGQLVRGVSVMPLERDGAVVVVGTREQHREVERALRIVDVAGTQVSIETAVADVSMSRLRELGLAWGVGTAPQGSGAIQITVGEAAVFARLSALVTDGTARVIASPRVTTRSGEKASVSLGEDVPIPQRDANGNVTYTFRRVGVGLDITPRVGRDGMVSVELGLRVEQVLEFLSTPSGPVPRIGTREVKSSVRVENGKVLVVGGLISRQERQSTVKVPLLGDIPILGELFRVTTRSESESEVVFLIRPVVVGRMPGEAGTGAPAEVQH